MRNVKTLAAILAALFLGTIAATLLTGCQPKKPRGPSVGPTSTTTDMSPEITIPKDEVKDAEPADEPADKPAENARGGSSTASGLWSRSRS